MGLAGAVGVGDWGGAPVVGRDGPGVREALAGEPHGGFVSNPRCQWKGLGALGQNRLLRCSLELMTASCKNVQQENPNCCMQKNMHANTSAAFHNRKREPSIDRQIGVGLYPEAFKHPPDQLAPTTTHPFTKGRQRAERRGQNKTKSKAAYTGTSTVIIRCLFWRWTDKRQQPKSEGDEKDGKATKTQETIMDTNGEIPSKRDAREVIRPPRHSLGLVKIPAASNPNSSRTRTDP